MMELIKVLQEDLIGWSKHSAVWCLGGFLLRSAGL